MPDKNQKLLVLLKSPAAEMYFNLFLNYLVLDYLTCY